jgi:hypothetical protein
MNSPQRVYRALSAGIPDRVPFIPKIWVDLAAAMTGTDLIEVVENPLTALRVLLDAALETGADGVRQYHFPERKTSTRDGIVYEVDRSGRWTGRVDMLGGLATHLFDADDYKIEDPYTMAHYHYWRAPGPVIKSMSDITRICVPDASFYREIGWGVRQQAIQRLAGDRIAVIGDLDSATLAFYECMRGMDNAMYDLIDEPAMVHGVMDKGVAIALEKGKFNINLGIRILRLNDSIANMSVISPGHWRRFIKPRIKVICDELHHYDPLVKIYCHICGNVLPVIKDLAETGLDCIAPLDPLGGFTCAHARALTGYGIALMGGINTMSFINSSAEEITDEALLCMHGAGEFGAFILGSGCVVPRSAKKENLLAVRDAALRNGKYQDGKLEPPLG